MTSGRSTEVRLRRWVEGATQGLAKRETELYDLELLPAVCWG